MLQIPLQAIPNQTLSIQVSANRWDLAIKEINGLMAMDFILNDVVLTLGVRMMPNEPLLIYAPYAQEGNFVLLTEEDEYPYYKLFGTSQSLIYASPTEITDILNAQ